MGKDSKIAWTNHTFSPWWGCTKVSPGCANCYAEGLAKRFGTGWGSGQPRRIFGEKHWREPLAWNRAAERAGVRARVFCASMCDVFEDSFPHANLDDERVKLWKLIDETPWLDWLLLTKRPENIRAMLPTIDIGGELSVRLSNVWLGTTVENRAALPRILDLVAVPATVHFISAEPLLEELDLGLMGTLPKDIEPDYMRAAVYERIDWVIGGGESGPHARPCHVSWLRSLRDQCKAAGVAYFCKQLGANAISNSNDDRRHCGDMMLPKDFCFCFRDRAGADPSEWPEDLRCRELPKGTPVVR